MTFQVLSLSGGGFLGLYSVSVLAELEKQTETPVAGHFDLIAGTSVGGIIALGLSFGLSAREIKETLEKDGARIFSDRSAPTTRLGQWRDLSRSFFSPKYNDTALRKSIESMVGADTLVGELKRPTVIPVVNLTKGKPQIFKTGHHQDFKRDHLLRVVDVALATSAAPTYFPVAEIEDELFADGGLYGNSPDLIALHEAEHFFGIPTGDIKMLSIGTTTTKFSFSHVAGRHLGVLDWGHRLAQTIISSQQMDVGYILEHKLGENYVRIDDIQSKEQERDLGLDIATKAAQRTIRGMASASVQDTVNNPVLQQMLNHQAPPPRFHYGTSKAP